MPYGIRKRGSGYKVVNKETGKTYSKKPMSKKKAEAQRAAIHANANESVCKFYKKLDEALDKLPGGLADNEPDSNFDQTELNMGIRHEMEHTQDEDLAREIAKDHLKEDPHYYSKMEAGGF